MNKFIDIGANEGQTLKYFYSKEWIKNPEEFKYIAFEPLHFEKWNELKEKYPIELIEKAAWIYDGKVKIGVHENTISSSIIEDKKDYTKENIKEFPCVDFSNWLVENRGSYNILKVNIEGGEFDLLERLLNIGTMNFINELYVEWHDDKMNGDYTPRKIEIEKRLASEYPKTKYESWRRRG